jgi:hypothetical protein
MILAEIYIKSLPPLTQYIDWLCKPLGMSISGTDTGQMQPETRPKKTANVRSLNWVCLQTGREGNHLCYLYLLSGSSGPGLIPKTKKKLLMQHCEVINLSGLRYHTYLFSPRSQVGHL